MSIIIDTHQHFWNLDKVEYFWLTPEAGPVLYRNIEPPELEPLLKKAGVDKTVIVQSGHTYDDNAYMLEAAEKYDWVAGVVGWVPLYDPDEAGKKLEEYSKNPYFKGIRHLIHEEPDPDFVVRDEMIEGLKVLASFNMTFDVVAVFPNHLKHVPTLAEKVPNLNMVIDHMAKPPIKDKGWEPWASQFKAAASYPQVYSKVSGLNTAAAPDWTAEDLKPYIDFALEAFGSKRLMFGSDWPVANLQGDYQQVWEETNKVLDTFSEQDRENILGKTAIRFYNL